MQLILLANIRGVSHGSAPHLPVPAVLFSGKTERRRFQSDPSCRAPHNEPLQNNLQGGI